jgi:hypothetical protein
MKWEIARLGLAPPYGTAALSSLRSDRAPDGSRPCRVTISMAERRWRAGRSIRPADCGVVRAAEIGPGLRRPDRIVCSSPRRWGGRRFPLGPPRRAATRVPRLPPLRSGPAGAARLSFISWFCIRRVYPCVRVHRRSARASNVDNPGVLTAIGRLQARCALCLHKVGEWANLGQSWRKMARASRGS